ncbi:MAG: hypothetical protein GY820_38575 [Gammaproteobacteria bacterium]|nr:hypothetical protein [Gammaproteobacteria bacterium]
MEGWIKAHRRIRNNGIWKIKPFSPGQAWFDLLLRANHKDSTVIFEKESIPVSRGSLITSIRKLAKEWGWSRTKVSSFLELLSKQQMITRKPDTKKTVLIINKYNLYQGDEDTGRTPNKAIINQIILYLNNIAGTDFKPGTSATVSKITARINEGYKLQDFKEVIDIKCADWSHDDEFSKYIRPETLFGNKFESYLNEKNSNGKYKASAPPGVELIKN